MSKRALAVIIAGFVTLFIAYAIRYCYGILLPEMLRDLAITKAEAGIIYAAYFLAYTIFSPIFGLMADKLNMRFILTVFPALLCVGTFLMAFSSSILNASLFWALAGLGCAASWSPVVTLVQRWVSDRRRGLALAFTDMGSGFGIVIWSWAMPYIVEASSWRVGWMSLAAVALVATILNFILVRSYPSDKSGIEQKAAINKITEPIMTTYINLFHSGKFWLIAMSYMLVGFSILIPYTFLPTHAMQTLGMPYQTAKWLIVIIAAAGIIGKLWLGHLSDTVGRIKIMMLCALLIAIGGAGMSCTNEFLVLCISAVFFGSGYGALWPVYAAVSADYFPKSHSGRIIGLWTLYVGIGSIVAPPLAGWTIDTTGVFTWAFLLTTVSAVLSLLLLLPLFNAPPRSAENL
jgi:MFS family permease